LSANGDRFYEHLQIEPRPQPKLAGRGLRDARDDARSSDVKQHEVGMPVVWRNRDDRYSEIRGRLLEHKNDDGAKKTDRVEMYRMGG